MAIESRLFEPQPGDEHTAAMTLRLINFRFEIRR